MDADTEQATGTMVPIRIAPWLYAEFLDIDVRMANPDAVAMLAIVSDGYTGELTAYMVYRYRTDDTEAEDVA